MVTDWEIANDDVAILTYFASKEEAEAFGVSPRQLTPADIRIAGY